MVANSCSTSRAGQRRRRLVHDQDAGLDRQAPARSRPSAAARARDRLTGARGSIVRPSPVSRRSASACMRRQSTSRPAPTAALPRKMFSATEVRDEVQLLVDDADAQARARRAGSRSRRGCAVEADLAGVLARTRRSRIFISVDLPAPFSPSSTCTSPARSSRSTPSSATTPGNCLRMPRICRTGGFWFTGVDGLGAWVSGADNATGPPFSLALRQQTVIVLLSKH